MVDESVVVRSKTGSMRDIRVRPFDIKEGAAAMYYPEANVLVPRDLDPKSLTPAFKAAQVRVVKDEVVSRTRAGVPAARESEKAIPGILRRVFRKWARPKLKAC